jgi:hypothetical protein
MIITPRRTDEIYTAYADIETNSTPGVSIAAAYPKGGERVKSWYELGE